MRDDLIPRYLVLVDGRIADYEHTTEAGAIKSAERLIESFVGQFSHRFRDSVVEVVRSVRRWELDPGTGEMLEVGEKVEQPAP